MVGYPVNIGWIIATQLRDKALNERAGLPFPYLIGKLCRQTNIPPNRLIDRWGEATRLIQVSKIKDVANHLFGVKFGVVGTLAVVSHVLLDIPHADRGPEQGSHHNLPHRHHHHQLLPHRLQEIKDEMQKELAVFKDRMDDLENLVQDRFQAAGLVDTEEFKSQLAEMRTQVAKLVEKPIQNKSGKRKHKAGEYDEGLHANLSKEERQQHKKARRASTRESLEKEPLEQQQRDAMFAGASGSGAPAPASGSQPDHVLSSESAPVDKGADAEPTTSA
uniref:Integrase core domain containing protein n=1 Tax=Solanum tuberosum TaxID=4113 RepID=M1DSN7_SOLTU